MKKSRAFGGRKGGWVKQPRAYVALALPIAIPLFLAAVRARPELGGPVEPVALAAMAPPQLRYDELVRAAEARLPEHALVLTVEKNDTLDQLLAAGGLGRSESNLLTTAFGKALDVRKLRPGQLIRFHYDRTGIVDAVQIKIKGTGEIEALRNAGGFEVSSHPFALKSVETTIAAPIDRSLYEALREQGENPQLAQQLVDIFQWDIDFFELRQGDSFSLVVPKQYSGPDMIGYGPVIAARFTHKGTTFEAFRHEMADGRSGYYASAGAPLRKQFLKAPLKFSRVTSGFSKKRFHPVLKYFRPHYGVDYGAPIGTPVMSTADGVVVEARFSPGEGNFIRLRHSSRYDTCYLHLSRFAKGLKRGTKVVQGDVIGYVGMSGLATGPHLDYRVSENGKWLNPLELRSITADPLRGASLTNFRANVARLLPHLSHPPTGAPQKEVQQRALF
ncbi:MAG: peptidoglycan DD-metalloendopeptidase family protein [Acidobacteriota bacterium]